MATDADRDNSQTAATVLAAFTGHGSHTADLVARFLKAWLHDLGFRGKPVFPTEFLVELGSILCIARWQESGVLSEASSEFPPWSELFNDLVERFCDEPLSLCRDQSYKSTPLDRQVVDFWFRHCSWSAPTKLGVDVAVPPIDNDGLLDELANFFWKFRNVNN